MTSEGGDWLECRIERLDEAYQRWQLRQLQLTHYHPNELGDIQTEPSVHGGLTDFGAEVIRRCNTLGIVVDVAHGTFELVKRAVATTFKPLLLSHTGLGNRASTGGVVGIWPVNDVANVSSYASGISRMVDVIGVIMSASARTRWPAGPQFPAELRRPAAACRSAFLALQARRDRQAPRRQLPPHLRDLRVLTNQAMPCVVPQGLLQAQAPILSPGSTDWG